jgi:hypothetical protein
VVVQPDNLILAAGRSDFPGTGSYDFTLLSLNWIGGRDIDFGTEGFIHTSLVAGDDAAMGVALQTDGKIVAAGSAHNGSNNDFAVARFYG